MRNSVVLQHFEAELNKAGYQVGVMLFAITMAWTLGLIVPSILLL